MQKSDKKATNFLITLGEVESILAQAQNATCPKQLTYNSHIHLPPNFSVFETIEQAVQIAADEGVQVLGCGNYYDYSLYRLFAETAQSKGIFPLFGTEIIAMETGLQSKGICINDPVNPGKYYICGKGISQFEQLSDAAADILQIIRNNDAQCGC